MSFTMASPSSYESTGISMFRPTTYNPSLFRVMRGASAVTSNSTPSVNLIFAMKASVVGLLYHTHSKLALFVLFLLLGIRLNVPHHVKYDTHEPEKRQCCSCVVHVVSITCFSSKIHFFYAFFEMARLAGFEPALNGLEDRDLIH